MNSWSLARLLFVRDWRAGELRLLFLALVIAVTALASVGFFVDRLASALALQARQLLGADLVISSDTPLSADLLEKASQSGLNIARTVVFPSMVEANGKTQLASIKAVSGNYPLRGQLRVAGPDGSERPARGSPGPGKAWADPQLVQALGLNGPTPDVELGDVRLGIAEVVTYEPDRGANFVNFAPRLLMSIDDLAASGLIQPASRVTYRLLLAGAPEQVAAFEAGVKSGALALTRGQRLESLENGRPELRSTLDRSEKFLALVSLLTALIAAVAIALAARQFALRHLDGSAIMKSLGLSQPLLQRALLIELAALGLVAGAAGAALGWALHHALLQAIAGLIRIDLPPAGVGAGLRALFAGLVLLIGFGAAPFVALAGVPPLRVLRRDLGLANSRRWLAPLMATLAYCALLLWFARDVRLALVALAGFAAAGLVFAVVATLVVNALIPVRGWLIRRGAAPIWRIALATWSSRRAVSVVQTVALSIGLMALVLLTVTRHDLLESWRRATPANAPNRFVINIQPDQLDAVQNRFKQAGLLTPELYPMIRGRLIAVNGRAVNPESYADERAARLVDREFNLSYGPTEPGHNKTVQGRWLKPEAAEVSVEMGIMKTLNLKLDDELTFEIAGESSKARITGVRKLAWDSMKVNFFMILSPAVLKDRPQTWITAYHQPEGVDLEQALVREFSNLTIFNSGNIVRQVQMMLEQVIRAIQALFILTLLAGLMVLYAALSGSRMERTSEAAVMRALGASRGQLLRAQMIEFAVTGALAGLLASAAALLVGWVLAERVFEFDYSPQWLGLGAGLLFGAVIATVAGLLGLRSVLNTPPVQSLRAQ